MSEIDTLEAQILGLQAGLYRILDDYKEKPTAQLDELVRNVRLDLVKTWTRMQPQDQERALAGPFGELHERMIGCGIRDEAPNHHERAIAQLMTEAMRRGWSHPETPAAVLAAMLLVPAAEVEVPPDLAACPSWLRPTVSRYLCEAPRSRAASASAAVPSP